MRVARFDVVLLDEPTNHLDADGLDRLAALLEDRAGGVVLVSHDRAFLERAANDVLEIDADTGTAELYAGGWETYERERDAARARARAEYDQAVARRAELDAAIAETRRRAAANLGRFKARPPTATRTPGSGSPAAPRGCRRGRARWAPAPSASRSPTSRASGRGCGCT